MEEAPEVASSAHAERVMQQFFRAAIRNPELSFNLLLGLSIAAFLVGVALVGAGFTVALTSDDTRTAIITGLFGGGGILAALGSVYSLASRGVSEANASHAKIRLVLTDFATELGHLRAVVLRDIEMISDVNKKIREAMTQAVDIIQTRVKIEAKGAWRTADGQVSPSSGKREDEASWRDRQIAR